MEFTFTFAEIINKIIDLSLLGMESFIAIWLFSAFAASVYPDSISLPAAPTPEAPTATAHESTDVEPPATDIASTINKLSYKSLRKLLSTLKVKCSGMNKESMITTLLSKITEEALDIDSLLATA
jgi:hypothetical protein